MARFRKITIAMYGDRRFTALTPLKPSGQALWIYLLTGPHTTAIPGLSTTTPGSLADSLGWPVAVLARHWREVEDSGMARADWKARVLWIPNAIKHNTPESPNSVRSWRVAAEEIPECQLKDEAIRSLAEFILTCGPGFQRAFREVFPEAFGEALAVVMSKPSPNQEQEQEHKDKDRLPSEACAEPLETAAPAPPDSPVAIRVPLAGNREPHPVTEADIVEWEELFPGIDVRAELRRLVAWNLANPSKRKTPRGVRSHITRWLDTEQNRARGVPPRSAPTGPQPLPGLGEGDLARYQSR